MKDIALNPDGSFLLTNNDLTILTDLDKLAQKLRIRLNFFRGEWFMDTTLGVRYREEIMIKNPNLANIDNVIKTTITETTGVLEILSYASLLNKSNRALSVNFIVNTVFGVLTLNEEI